MAIDVEFENINDNGSGKLFAVTSNEHMPIGQLFYKVDEKNKEVDVDYIYIPRKWSRQQGIKEQLFAELKASFPRYAVNLNGIKTKQSAFEKESPARSKAQFRYMQGICNGSIEPPEGMTRAKACEFVKHQKDYKELPEKASNDIRKRIYEDLTEGITPDDRKGMKKLTPRQKAEITAIKEKLEAEIAAIKARKEEEGEDFVHMPVPNFPRNDEHEPIRRQEMSPTGTNWVRSDLEPELNEMSYLDLNPENAPPLPKQRRKKSSYSHKNYLTGKPCDCTFTRHLNMDRESKWQRISSKLDKIIQENPKVLRTEEGQKVLEWLKTLSEKIDPFIPWIVREYKKQRLIPLPEENGNVTQMIGGPNSPREFGDFDLDEQTLSHWADWFESKSPTRRGVDIMGLDLEKMTEKISEWDTELAEKMEQEANSAKGEVIYKYGPPNEGWTMRNVRSDECREEGDLMGHCVGGYSHNVASGDIKILSLRDPKNHPHATLEVYPDGRVVQIQGKQNVHPIGAYRKMIHEFITQGFERYMGTTAKPDKTVTSWDNIAGEFLNGQDSIDSLLDDNGSEYSEEPEVSNPFDPMYDNPDYRYQGHPAGRSGYDYNPSHYGMDPSQVSLDYGRILRDHPRELDFVPSSDYQGLGQTLYEAAKARGELPLLAKEFEKYNQEKMDEDSRKKQEMLPSFDEGPDWTVSAGKEGGWRDIFEKATGRIDPSLLYPFNSPEYKEAMLDYKRGWNDWVRANFTGQQVWPGFQTDYENQDADETWQMRDEREKRKREFFDVANRNTLENLLSQHRNNLGEYSNEETNPLQRDERGNPIIPTLDQMVINRSLVDTDEPAYKVHPEQMALFSKWKIAKPNLVPPEGVRAAARRGIKYHAEGKAGDGFEDATLDRAHKIANGEELTPEHVKRMHSFFERHAGGRSQKAKKGETTPWDVAWLAWGGNAGRSWAASKVKELEKSEKTSKNCKCWDGYKRVPGTKPCAPGSCEKCDKARKKSESKKKGNWKITDGDKKKELDPSLIESALNSYGEADIYDYFTAGFRRGARETISRLNNQVERGTRDQITFDFSESLMKKDDVQEWRYEISEKLIKFDLNARDERLLIDVVMNKIFWPWYKKGREYGVDGIIGLTQSDRRKLWYNGDILKNLINGSFEEAFHKNRSKQNLPKWKIAAKDVSTLEEWQIITPEWAGGQRLRVMWSGFWTSFLDGYTRGQESAMRSQDRPEDRYDPRNYWHRRERRERRTPDQLVMPLVNDVVELKTNWKLQDEQIRKMFNWQTGITPSNYWQKGRMYTPEGKPFNKKGFLSTLIQDFNVFKKSGYEIGLYHGSEDLFKHNMSINQRRREIYNGKDLDRESLREKHQKIQDELSEMANKKFKEQVKEYAPDLIPFIDDTRLSSIKKSYFEEFETESGNDEYGDHLLIKDPETDEIIGSVYYALAPNGNGTMVYYIGYGDKLHPVNNAEEVEDIKSRYPRIGVEIFKWVRNNLPEPYYAAFANQDLKRVLRAEPTGMNSYDMVTGEPVSVDIIRRSKVENYIKKSESGLAIYSPNSNLTLLEQVKEYGFNQGINATRKFFILGPHFEKEKQRMPENQLELMHYSDPREIRDWWHQSNSRGLSVFYDSAKQWDPDVEPIEIDEAYLDWFNKGVNFALSGQAQKNNPKWPLRNLDASEIFIDILNKTSSFDEDDDVYIPYGYLGLDAIINYYLTDQDIERMKNVGLALGMKKALDIIRNDKLRPSVMVPREQTTMSLDFTPPNALVDNHTYMRMRDTAIDILSEVARVSQEEIHDRTSVAVELTNRYSVPYFSIGYNEINNLYKTNPEKLKEVNGNDINSLYDFIINNQLDQLKISKWKIAKEQVWEIVLDGTEGHDIIGTGSFEECRKKTEEWLKDFIGGYINYDTEDDAYPIPKDAKEQDKIALEELKKAEDTGRWSFYFDYDKPFDLIIQPFEKKKESKWKISARDKNIREVMKEWQQAIEDGDTEKERQMEEKFWALRGMKKEFVEKYGPSDVRRLGKTKISNDGYWSTPQTELVMELINSSPLTFRGGPSVKLDKIVRRGGSVQDLANFVIQNFVIPYNEDLQWRWQETTDQEDVEWQKKEHRKEWKQQARKQFPFSIPKQRQYVREMEQMQYGLLGDPTPYKLEDYIIDVSKIDWNQIYNVIKRSLRTSKWKKTSATPFVMQVLEMHDNGQSIDQIAKALKTAPREVKRIVKSDLRQRPYEGLDMIQQYEKALMHKDEQKRQEMENKIWEEAGYLDEYEDSSDFYQLMREALRRKDRKKEHELMQQFWSERGLGEEYEQKVRNPKQPSQEELDAWTQEELNKISQQ